MDATYIPIWFNGVYDKQAIYLVCRITNDGYHEILGYTIGFSENLSLWEELLSNLKDRDLEEYKIYVMDGAKGVAELTRSLFLETLVQACVFHSMKNLANNIRKQDHNKIMPLIADFYKIQDREFVNNK